MVRLALQLCRRINRDLFQSGLYLIPLLLAIYSPSHELDSQVATHSCSIVIDIKVASFEKREKLKVYSAVTSAATRNRRWRMASKSTGLLSPVPVNGSRSMGICAVAQAIASRAAGVSLAASRVNKR